MTDPDPYTILGLTRQASLLEIKKTYFKLVHQYPPETDPDGFRRIRSAYEALRTSQARANTDRQLIQAPPPPVISRRVLQPDLTFHPEDAWLAMHHDLERCDGESDFRPLPDMSEV